MEESFLKKHRTTILIVLAILCLLSTPISRLLANYYFVPADTSISIATNYAQSIRLLCAIGLLAIIFKKDKEEQ